jgi:hypothetical protein
MYHSFEADIHSPLRVGQEKKEKRNRKWRLERIDTTLLQKRARLVGALLNERPKVIKWRSLSSFEQAKDADLPLNLPIVTESESPPT